MNTKPVRIVLSLALLGSVEACLSSPEPGGMRDPDAGPAAITVHTLDFSGSEVDALELPRRPRFVLELPRALDSKDEPVMLLRGELNETLESDLERAPINGATAEQIVPSTLEYARTGRVTLSPRDALEPGATYTLVVAGFARYVGDGERVDASGHSWSERVMVSTAPEAGARVLRALPEDGSSGVPTNLAFAALVFDGEVVGAADAVWLQDADGLAAPADVMRVACDELDDAGESCLAITPRGALRASSSYALRTGVALRDAYGAPLPSFTSSFITATGADRQRPRWQDLACGIDEQALDAGCALIDDARITLRLQADEAVRFTIDDGRAKHVELSARGALHWTQSDLSEDTTLRFAVAAIDAAGNTTRTSFSLTTEHDLPTLSISEVLANPRGPEPAQELVEVHNFGREPIALDGFALSDSADQPGTPFVTDAVVQPGARVLLVPDAFVPDDTLDVPPPPGTLLVHVGKSLGKAGLANAGEPLFLRDPLGRRVSAAPASPPPKPGVCIVRTSPDPRSGEPSSFGYDAGDSCTPGR